MDIYIDGAGVIHFVHNDDVAELFKEDDATTRRASHVEPSSGGKWTADLSPVGGPVLGPTERRGDALAAEVAWLDAALAAGTITEPSMLGEETTR